MKHLFATAFFAFVISILNAQTTTYFASNGAAIQGYDAVAYFKDNAAVQGSQQFGYKWQGTTWNFKNQENLDAFKADPEKYAPQFGGYCAYGASQNHKSPTEPEAFTVIDGKLYLNYNSKVKELWMKDTDGYIKKANLNWVTLKEAKN